MSVPAQKAVTVALRPKGIRDLKSRSQPSALEKGGGDGGPAPVRPLPTGGSNSPGSRSDEKKNNSSQGNQPSQLYTYAHVNECGRQFNTDDLVDFTQGPVSFPVHPILESSAVLDALQESRKLAVEQHVHFQRQQAQEQRRFHDAQFEIVGDTRYVRERIVFQHFLNGEQHAYVKKHAPHIQVVPARHTTAHSHPILNFDRACAEKRAYEYIKATVSKLSREPEDSWIIDVGGNASRHRAVNRQDVHSCNPILNSTDVIRNINHVDAPNRCNHKAEDCNCKHPTAYLSVDSLYYLDRQTIADLVSRSTSNLLVAVVHEFNDAYGSFANGEAVYQLIDHDTVSMKVRGNHHAYVHSSMVWMKETSWPCVVNGVKCTLVWTKLDDTIAHSIYVFSVTTLPLQREVPIMMSLESSVKNTNYYGKIMTGPISEEAKIDVAGETVDIPTVRLYSFGPFVLLYDHVRTQPLFAPKHLISCAVANCMLGKPRNAETFSTLLAYIRHYIKKINLPPTMLAETAFAAACIAFIQTLEFETTTMHSIIKPHMKVAEVHTEALKLKFARVWTLKKAALAVMSAAAIIGIGAKVVPVATLAAVAKPVVSMVVKKLVPYLAIGAAGLSLYEGRRAIVNAYNNADLYKSYLHDRSSNVLSGHGSVAKLILPSTLPPKTIDQLLATEIDPSASLEVKDESSNKSTSHIVNAGICSTHNIPIVPTSGVHSEISCCVERGLKVQPFHTAKFDVKFFDEFEATVLGKLHVIFPGMHKIVPTPFETWNRRFETSRQVIQRRSFAEVVSGADRDWKRYAREMFIKLELNLKSTSESVPKFAPRMIQGATSAFNVMVGPYFHSYSESLKKCWSVDNTLGPIYTSGASAEAIGACFERSLIGKGNVAILEGDFNRYDTTIHRRLLELEVKLNRKLGAPELVLKTLLAAIKTVGYGKHGTSYSVDGTRHSGDPQTSCGNTTLQVLAHLFCLSKHCSMSIDEILRLVTIFALGDDVVIVAPEEMLIGFDSAVYLSRLGFIFEPKLHTGPEARYHVTFCSGRFYPCQDLDGKDYCVHAPNIGRVYSKYGYYCCPPYGMDLNRLVRGDALSRRSDCSMLPCIRLLVERSLQLTSTVDKPFITKEIRHRLLSAAGTSRMYRPSAHTYKMVELVYGLTFNDELEYERLLSTLTTLPSVCDFSPLRKCAIVDGDLTTNEKSDNLPATSITNIIPTANAEAAIAQSFSLAPL